jgi:hypothetical protein
MYKLKLMFEWGGGTIWCDNDQARDKFDVGPVEGKLNLSKQTLDDLEKLTVLHDSALNWEYPPDPSPWSPTQFEAFDIEALDILNIVKNELGSVFDIEYSVLGGIGI